MVSFLLSTVPLALLAILLLAGRFVGEERILRHLRGRMAPRRHRTRRPLRPRRAAVVSRLALTSLSGRGPPIARVARIP